MRKILVIEDDLNVRDVVFEILTFHDYEVKTVHNGFEALKLLEVWVPHLILCDIMMPVMDGHVFHEELQKDKSLAAIPFVYLTAKTEENLARKCLNKGADDFVSKPFKANELLEILKTKIERFEKIKKAHFSIYKGKKKHFVHEINTPLNGIVGIATLLTDHSDNLEKEDALVLYQSIKKSGERLNRTMQNLLMYEELIENNLTFNLKASDEVSATMRQVLVSVQQNYDNSDQRIECNVEAANLKVEKKYLQFILYELIDNALKFSDNQQVCISGNLVEGSSYEICIKDRGIGFSKTELKNISSGTQFNRDKLEQQGLGLGLALSKELIEKSDGSMTIESSEHKGTTIVIRFAAWF